MSVLRFLLPLALFLAIQGQNVNATPFPGLKNAFALAEDDNATVGVDKIDYRLPKSAKPISYEITLTPNLQDFTYAGESIIKIKILEDTKNITLHSYNITYLDGTSVIITNTQKETSVPVTLEEESVKDFLIINPTNPQFEFKKGNDVTVLLKYTNKLNDNLRGFYRSSYIDKDGKTRWLATTHFEPTGARLAFPCFDEPALKATFNITIDLKYLKNYTALSNMPAIKPIAPTSETKITFETTPLMSSYLVAFVVSDFKNNGNVWIREQLLPDTNFSRDTGDKMIKAIQNYLNVSYDLPEIKQVGIPDFQAGAMENWGLVTYREKALVYNEKTSTASQKQAVASIIAHEFAHQWFGDRVSPAWWKYLWLNEGFATFFQDFITDNVYDFKMRDQFVVKTLQASAFSFDATESSHPMNVEVNSPSEINNIFDAISYQKSGSVIRMMQHFLTDDVFKSGLEGYLKKLTEDAASSDDLFDMIDWESDLNLTEIMNTWVTQAGYPVIHVMKNDKTLHVHQKRFFMEKPKEPSTAKWWIPINFVTKANVDEGFENTTASHWLSPNGTLEINDVNPDEWFIFNKQQTGYYRVNYETENWNRISAYLQNENFTLIHDLNRAQLLDDAWSLARSGELSYSIPIDISEYLIREINYLPWYAEIRHLNYLKNQLISTSHYEKFKETALKWSSKLVESVGFVDKEEDDHITKLTRNLALEWVCGLGFENCTKEYEATFYTWLIDENYTISPELKSLVLCSVLTTANETTWKEVYDRYLKSEDSAEEIILLKSLGCSRNATILENYLDLAISPNSKERNNVVAFQSVYNGNEIGLNVTLNFIIENSHGIIIHDKGVVDNLHKYISDIGKKITTEEQLNKLNDFISRSKSLQGKATASAIEEATKKLEWIKNNGETIVTFMTSGAVSSLQFAAIMTLIPVFIALFNSSV